MQQRSKEWHELRRTKIGASDAPIIMGMGFRTPYQLWREKMGMDPPQQSNSAMEWGLFLEPRALAEVSRELKIDFEPNVVVSDEYPWMMASFDGISPCGQYVVEVKCPGEKDHAIAMNGEIPQKYIYQLVHQLIVSKLDTLYYFSYSEESWNLIQFDRNDTEVRQLIKEERKFWDLMQSGEPPELTDSDYVRHSSSEWFIQAANFSIARQEIKKWQEKEEEVKQRLIELADGRNAMGGGIKLMKVLKKGTVDYKVIPEIQEVDLEKYRKPPSEYWRVVA